MQFFSLRTSKKIRCFYNSIDAVSNGIIERRNWIQNKSQWVIWENDKKVDHILKNDEIESVSAIAIADVTIDAIRQTRDVPLLLKIKQDTYISVVSTSMLDDGTEFFTVRYGITTESKFPEFSGISLLVLRTDGTLSQQEVVTQSNGREEFEIYSEQLIQILGWSEQESYSFPENQKLKLENTMKYDGSCDIYDIGLNYQLNPVYILNISNLWDPKVWLQCEIRKFYNGEPAYQGMNSVYIGSMVKWSEVSVGESLLRVISERKALGIEDDWKVYFFRDDTHDRESKVRTVAQYKKLFPSH